MDLKSLCEDVMESDPKIRFSMIVVDGEKKYGGYRYDVVKILDSDELDRSIWYAYERMCGRYGQEHKLGKTKFALGVYENVKRATFPLNRHTLLLVSMEPNSDHDGIINKVLKLIEKA